MSNENADRPKFGPRAKPAPDYEEDPIDVRPAQLVSPVAPPVEVPAQAQATPAPTAILSPPVTPVAVAAPVVAPPNLAYEETLQYVGERRARPREVTEQLNTRVRPLTREQLDEICRIERVTIRGGIERAVEYYLNRPRT